MGTSLEWNFNHLIPLRYFYDKNANVLYRDVQHYDFFFSTDIFKVPCTEYHLTKSTTCNCEHNNFAMTECCPALVGIKNLFQKKFLSVHSKFICRVFNTIILFWNHAAI